MFCHYYPPHQGGIEIVVHELVTRLARAHRVTVVTSGWGGRSGVERSGALTIWRLPATHLTERFGVPFPVPWGPHMRAALREASTADVFHAHGALYPYTAFAVRLAARTKRPLVLTEHVGFIDYRSGALNAIQSAAWRLVGDPTVRRAAVVTTLGARVRDWLRARRPDADVRIVPNGVDLERFHPPTAAQRAESRRLLGLPDVGTLALFVGRATARKNLDEVLSLPREAFSLVTCGARRDLRSDRVFDVGLIPFAGMPQLYHACDLLIHAADGEGFPLAVQEAMACGMPVALRWDESYSANVSRELVASFSDLAGMDRAVAELAEDAGYRTALAGRGRQWAESHWDWETTTTAFASIYDEVRERADAR